jgi:hypothetical protein
MVQAAHGWGYLVMLAQTGTGFGTTCELENPHIPGVATGYASRRTVTRRGARLLIWASSTSPSCTAATPSGVPV